MAQEGHQVAGDLTFEPTFEPTYALTYALTFAVGAVFKNEAHALVEWVEHYLGHGAQHLVLIDDDSTDGGPARLAPYVERGVVTLLSVNDAERHDASRGRQTRIYDRLLLGPDALVRRWDWFAMLDLDEFLYAHDAVGVINLRDALFRVAKPNPSVAQIGVDWVHFGSNGHVKQPPSIVAGFTRRARLTTHTDKYYSYKSIVRTNALVAFDVHQHAVRGQTRRVSWSVMGDVEREGGASTTGIAFPLSEGVCFLINHYSLQSEEYWRTVKMTRGDVNRWHATEARDMQWFRDYDINEVDDYALRDYGLLFA